MKHNYTADSRREHTPYQAIRVSQFIENQQQATQCKDADTISNQELNLNIMKIKECKRATEQCINQMGSKIQQQNRTISSLQNLHQRQREKCKQFRMKYHQALMELRRKQEDNESLQRSLLESQQKYQFFLVQSKQNRSILAEGERRYKERINQLELLLQSVLNSKNQQIIEQRVRQHKKYQKQQQSTFI